MSCWSLVSCHWPWKSPGFSAVFPYFLHTFYLTIPAPHGTILSENRIIGFLEKFSVKEGAAWQ